MSRYLPLKRKIALTFVVTALVAVLGTAYQYYYLEERGEYEEAIRQHYLDLYGQEPDPEKLHRLTTVALDRYGPTEFYRNEMDYQKLFSEEAE